MLLSFVLNAQQGFDYGVTRLIARLFELGIVGEKDGALPTSRSYNAACSKLPAAIVQEQMKRSHLGEYEANGRTFHGLKVLIPDGTKVSITNTPATRDKYGAGQGHYVQSQTLGFYELSTGTFEDFRFEHYTNAERAIAIRHMSSNPTRSLYVADAGYNGMAFIAICLEQKHELLMQLKNCALAKNFLKSGKRSIVMDVKL